MVAKVWTFKASSWINPSELHKCAYLDYEKNSPTFGNYLNYSRTHFHLTNCTWSFQTQKVGKLYTEASSEVFNDDDDPGDERSKDRDESKDSPEVISALKELASRQNISEDVSREQGHVQDEEDGQHLDVVQNGPFPGFLVVRYARLV